MVTLEMAGRPLQPPWPPLSPHILKESCQQPPLPNFKTIPSLCHPESTSNWCSTGTYIAQYILTMDCMTIAVALTMGHTILFLHSTLPMAQLLQDLQHGIIYSMCKSNTAPATTHSCIKPPTRNTTNTLDATTATITHYISSPFNKKSTKKDSLSLPPFTTDTCLPHPWDPPAFMPPQI